MRFMMQIYQRDALAVQEDLSREEQQRVWADYAAIRDTPGVSPGERLADPVDAKTVRIESGKTLMTDGPFAETKEALAGFYLFEARDLNEAIQLAAKIPPARVGCVEVRPIRPIREQPRAGRTT